MIKVQVLASGSKGNCTAVTANNATILFDLGINFSSLQRALNFENPTAVFLTHEHSDHVNKSTLAELLKRGVEVYMTKGTAQALKLEPRHNLKFVETYDPYFVRELEVRAFSVSHDATDPVNFYVSNGSDELFYVTDTGYIYPELKILTDYLIIEANYDVSSLLAADIDEHQKNRIRGCHLSIQNTAKIISNADRRKLKEVHLIHISKRHGNAEKFRQIIREIVGDNVKVFAY